LIPSIDKHFGAFLQKLGLTLTFFMRHELRNHAAAAAYYMLLSMIPLVLILIYIFDTFLSAFPNFSKDLFVILQMFNSNITPEMFDSLGISGGVGGTLGVIGGLNLLWSSRLILLSIQRAFSLIFPSDKSRNFILENLTAFVVLPAMFLFVMAVAILNSLREIIVRYLILHKFNVDNFDLFFDLITYGTPVLIAFIMVFLSYRFLPVSKPATKSALKGALLFVTVFAFARFGVMSLFGAIPVSSAYGLVGGVIILMIWAYFVFLLYLFCAQYVFVNYKADVLILERLVEGKRSEYFISLNRHVLDKYIVKLGDGELLFAEGDDADNVYYLMSGSFSMVSADGFKGAVAAGEIFGEMAYLTGEKRSVSMVAQGVCDVIVLPPEIFDEILEGNTALTKRIMKVMCRRLKRK